MQLTTSLSLLLASLPWAVASSKCGNFASPIEGLTQGGYRLAHSIDSKNYTLLNQAFTDDVYYDSSALAPYGGVAKGKQAAIAAIKAAYYSEGVKMEHLVTNLFVLEMQSAERARVVTDITWSHWDPAALEDIQKTFRFYYQCDDIWVCQGGGWSLKYSVVKNMGPGVEAPYKAQLLKSN
ncbi:hypothetical protein HBI56_164360 [Parastagonospora nodorum]|uniref:SnoaL-like domain-containing protein n=2 Tax=Phaeosphaeria nodorum (strain SN15 / ATCC MYA-4574 / FGSC 10173) TaxID=321614 RepID=A0A7U2NQD4_PHANO|nr:hypothetical protein SNOG_13504 [Parastagonospora nodorum SN15]KAH3915292.1 hypothetical protein HBH56_072140 [Parastagonospora nodorum]EAT78951.1 hypothetical protein SNOG_13504 [Parastagonospora nodorum SN15]KAH3927335.1 hypothetical protein HBH54_152370 [Parastagonospora nodorum]KAH3952295.1 hypothetical protein HBH53_056000 [Parastagonospora nodorum]KAH3982000.1 hypothetical protein HBH51_039120 [Parastagonospora nodorum]